MATYRAVAERLGGEIEIRFVKLDTPIEATHTKEVADE
jgi:hypothetical protein